MEVILNIKKWIKILLKIYKNGNVIGSAFAKVTLILKPGELYENEIEFTSSTNTQGDNIVVVNSKLIF